jgi:hypothetical protein
VCDVGSAVDGRFALFERLGTVVVDPPVAVDGLDARRQVKQIIHLTEEWIWFLPVARLCDVGRSFVAVVLLVDVAVRDAAVEDVACEEPPVALLEAVFAGGFVDGWGGRALVFVVEAVGTVDDEGLPSGAVESVVVCWSDGDVGSEAFGTVEGRVVFVTGLTVDRDAAVVVVVVVVVELAAGFGFVVAVAVDGGLAGTSR